MASHKGFMCVRVSVSVCVCVCVRARARAWVAASRRRLLLKGLQQLSEDATVAAPSSDVDSDRESALDDVAGDGKGESACNIRSKKRPRAEQEASDEDPEQQDARIDLIGRCVRQRCGERCRCSRSCSAIRLHTCNSTRN